MFSCFGNNNTESLLSLESALNATGTLCKIKGMFSQTAQWPGLTIPPILVTLMTYKMSSTSCFTAPIHTWPLSARFLCLCFLPQVSTMSLLFWARKEKKLHRQWNHSLHQLRKRRHIGPKGHVSLLYQGERGTSEDLEDDKRPLLQTKTLRATGYFKSASGSCQFVCI